MDNLQFTLTKTIEYNLKPFGRFTIKMFPSKALAKKEHIISFNDLDISYKDSMPYSIEDEKAFVKYMRKHKTDVLVEEHGNYKTFYTRVGNDFVPILTSKLHRYSTFLKQQELEDNAESWKFYIQ